MADVSCVLESHASNVTDETPIATKEELKAALKSHPLKDLIKMTDSIDRKNLMTKEQTARPPSVTTLQEVKKARKPKWQQRSERSLIASSWKRPSTAAEAEEKMTSGSV